MNRVYAPPHPRRSWRLPIPFLLALVLAAGIASAQTPAANAPGSAASFVFGGHYADLSPRQQALLDDWVRRFNEAQDTDFEAVAVYNQVPISLRTTFEAVTHALSRSTLTGQAGDTLGTALDLIGKLDHIKGRVPGARGDLQFRIYVELRADALATLEECREFTRCHDNTVFHKSYPLNYRQGKGAPSIQISMTRDGRYADIDVDYRSSFFAVALFDGHLTAANSDIRAGNNIDRHNGRWVGLTSWWQNLFASIAEGVAGGAPPAAVGEEIELPRHAKGRIEDAVHDYLASWLVEREPWRSLGYVSEQAFDCVPAAEPAQTVDRAAALARKLKDMQAASQALGQVANLGDVVAPVDVPDSRLRRVKQHHGDLFTLYEVPAAVPGYQCGDPDAAAGAEETGAVGYKIKSSGRYVASFVLHAQGRRGFPVLQVWYKDAGIWRIESFRLQADPSWAAIPDVRPAIEESDDDILRVPGDPAVVQATTEFLEAWFVRRDLAAALAYLADQSLACVNLDLPPGDVPLSVPADQRAQTRDRMDRVAVAVGKPSALEECLEQVAPVSAATRLVMHPHAGAFALLVLPDHIGVTMDCEREWQDADSVAPVEGDENYGNHYLAVFRCGPATGEGSAVFKLHWARENGQWRVLVHILAD